MPRDFSEDGAIGAGGGGDPGAVRMPGQFGSAPNSFSAPTQQSNSPETLGGFGPSNSGVGLSWSMEDGGAIDDTDGSPQQDAIQKALSTVDGVLAYGRKLHGLGGGDNEGAIQTAGLTRMPTQPASQSESGVKPLQPMPGPLPPTSNPFGKRTADASGSDNDSDDNSGAIDTEEETA